MKSIGIVRQVNELGRIMQVIEPVSIITEADNVKTKVAADGYREMKKGKPYVIFLKSNGLGGYSVINMNDGKSNTDGSDSQDVPTDAKEKAFKEELKAAVKEKYNLK